MRASRDLTLIVTVLLLGGCHRGTAAHAAVPVAPVTVEPLVHGALSSTITGYGAVTAGPRGQRRLARAFATTVVRVDVLPGARVARGEVLLEVRAAPESMVARARAQTEARAARAALAETVTRFKLGLATHAALLSARAAATAAQAQAALYEGGGAREMVTAPVAGVVAQGSLPAVGQVVPAGTPLAVLLSPTAVLAQIAVDPRAVRELKIGAEATVRGLDASGSATPGRVVSVSGDVDPATHLARVYVALPANSGFLLGEPVRARLTLRTVTGFVVPRAAVLPERGESVLYTVKDDHAVRHVVTVVMDTPEAYEVTGPGLATGDAVVVVGNYELRAGMQVDAAVMP